MHHVRLLKTAAQVHLPDILRKAQGAAECWLTVMLDTTSCQSEPDAGLEYAMRRARRSCELGTLHCQCR